MRILTLNIQQYSTRHGPWPVRRELIVSAIRAADPDVVALQAVRRDSSFERGVDQAAQLARMLDGYDSLYAPATEVGNDIAEGSAFLTRVPFIETEVKLLELCEQPCEDAARRLIMRARFDLDGARLDLFNCHLSWVAAKNEKNLAEGLPFFTATRGPRLVVGDMNAEAPKLRPLAEAGLVDLWPRLHPEEPGFTFEQGRLFTRIDHAWASEDVAARVKAIDVAGALSARGKDDSDEWRPSDHLGLVVQLS